MKATILNIGDELLIGQVVNTNASRMAQMLVAAGIDVCGTYVIGDDDCVYLKSPFTFFPTQSYLKLEHLNGDTLVAHMPQAILAQSGSEKKSSPHSERIW